MAVLRLDKIWDGVDMVRCDTAKVLTNLQPLLHELFGAVYNQRESLDINGVPVGEIVKKRLAQVSQPPRGKGKLSCAREDFVSYLTSLWQLLRCPIISATILLMI